MIIIVFTTLLAFALPSMTYAKSGGYDDISDMVHHTVQQDDLVALYPVSATTYAYSGNLACQKHVEHSCQTFGVLTCPVILSLSINCSIENIRYSPIRTQISVLQFLKPPRS